MTNPMETIATAHQALATARALSYHVEALAELLDQVATSHGDDDAIADAHRWLGARVLAETLLAQLPAVDTVVREAEVRCRAEVRR